jgi:hypothetical protein
MKPQALVRCIVGALALVSFLGSAVAAGAEGNAATKHAYLERIGPLEYGRVESLGPKLFSATCDVVFLRTERNRLVYALTFRSEPKVGYSVETYFITDETKSADATDSIPFDAKVARPYFVALSYRLSRFVTIVEKSHKPADYETAWWIYYHGANGAIAGLIDAADFESNPDAKAFHDLFIAAPEQLLKSDSAQQAEILADISRQCADVIQSESAH